MSSKESGQNEELLPNRSWSVDEEIKLFSLVCDYKPAGSKKHKNMAVILNKINESIEPLVPPLNESDVWQKLQQLFNLSKIDLLEGLSGDEITNSDSLDNASGNTTAGEESVKPTLTRKKDFIDNANEQDDKEEKAQKSLELEKEVGAEQVKVARRIQLEDD